VQQNQARRRIVITKRRRRNPTVAQYLGLGPSSESNHLEQNVSASDRTCNLSSASTPKRRKLGNKNDATPYHLQPGNQNAPLQTRVFESLRVMKPRHSSAASSKALPDEPLASSITPGQGAAAQTSLSLSRQTSAATIQLPCHNSATRRSLAACAEPLVEVTSWLHTPDDYVVTPFRDSDEVEDNFDVTDQIDEIRALSSDCVFDDDDEEFNDDLDDEEFLELTSQNIDPSGETTIVPNSPCHSDSTHTVGVGDDEERPSSTMKLPAPPEKHVGNTQRSSKNFVSPMTLTSRLLASTGDIDCAEARKPIARQPFPGAVRDRSPIIGLSSETLLRTCFRIGEAINQAHQSFKNGKRVILELYARILESSRDDTKQHFTFCDLFHGKPPHVKGFYDRARWQSVQLFDYDSKRLLKLGRICRCMGTMKRDGKDWVMEVSSIWEATWDDIKWVEGIVSA
jgi:hypothetical protein